jgi:hypothetical protein
VNDIEVGLKKFVCMRRDNGFSVCLGIIIRVGIEMTVWNDLFDLVEHPQKTGKTNCEV